MSNIKFFSIDSSNIDLANNIVHRLRIKLSAIQIKKLNNGENTVHIEESVRNQDVYILQSFQGNMKDRLMEILLMVQACKLGAASRVTAVIPYFPNAWQGEDEAENFQAEAETMVNMYCFPEVDRIITLDRRSPRMVNLEMSGIPVVNLSVEPAILSWIKEIRPELSDCCIVSPHAGSANKRAITIADQLGIGFAVIHKQRPDPLMETLCDGQVDEVSFFVGDVKDRTAIVIDDMEDTCGTLVNAADKLKEAGASQVYAIVTHRIFSRSALSLINDSCLDAVVATNTISQDQHVKDCPKIQCIDSSKILADAILNCSLILNCFCC